MHAVSLDFSSALEEEFPLCLVLKTRIRRSESSKRPTPALMKISKHVTFFPLTMWGWGYGYRSDWFHDLMGFTEDSYKQAKASMEVVPGPDDMNMLKSKVTGKAYGCGNFEMGA